MLLDAVADQVAAILATSPVVASAMASIILSSLVNMVSGTVSRIAVPVCACFFFFLCLMMMVACCCSKHYIAATIFATYSVVNRICVRVVYQQ